MTKPLESIIKEYPKRGPLQQYRLERSVAFECFRCHQSKISRLVCVYGGWGRILCNGCYGRLLSIFEIKAGSADLCTKANELLRLLSAALSTESLRQEELRLRTAEQRSSTLTPEAVRFIATSDFIARQLPREPMLEWSPAVIGLCKAFEHELVHRLMLPLVATVGSIDLSPDFTDKDLARVARHVAGRVPVAPELGTTGHFLQTAANSKERAQTSPLLRVFKDYCRIRPGAGWLLSPQGASDAIARLCQRFRNRAAHLDELAKEDYESCRDFVIGPAGVMWELVVATAPRQR